MVATDQGKTVQVGVNEFTHGVSRSVPPEVN
jgi:hypothetical protein